VIDVSMAVHGLWFQVFKVSTRKRLRPRTRQLESVPVQKLPVHGTGRGRVREDFSVSSPLSESQLVIRSSPFAGKAMLCDGNPHATLGSHKQVTDSRLNQGRTSFVFTFQPLTTSFVADFPTSFRL